MTAKLLLFAAFVICMLIMSYNFKKKKKRIILFGDSITEQGSRPGGYVRRLVEYLKSEELDDKYEIIGSGISGNKVTDLYDRVDEDILSKGAEIVVIYIGINDVWHKTKGQGTEEVTFTSTYDALVEKLKAAGIKVIVCTTSVIGEKIDHSNDQDDDVNLYAELVRSIASRYELPLADIRKAFLEYNLMHNVSNIGYGMLTTDMVHLNERGNQLVADEIWRVLAPELKQ